MPPYAPHLARTSSQPRQQALHKVRLSHIHNVNPRIRLLKFSLPEPIKFLPGQWLDVHIPGIANAGGFTITSTPAAAAAAASPYLELAVGHAPKNPPAAWLWRDEAALLGQTVDVRVGGSFVWPPVDRAVGTGKDASGVSRIQRLVMVAGGVGVNPLISMLASMIEDRSTLPRTVRLLYSTRLPEGEDLNQILFWPRLRRLFAELNSVSSEHSMDLYLTECKASRPPSPAQGCRLLQRRFGRQDLLDALGAVNQRDSTVAYVCGPARMTDEVAAQLESAEGMAKDRVYYEKWW